MWRFPMLTLCSASILEEQVMPAAAAAVVWVYVCRVPVQNLN